MQKRKSNITLGAGLVAAFAFAALPGLAGAAPQAGTTVGSDPEAALATLESADTRLEQVSAERTAARTQRFERRRLPRQERMSRQQRGERWRSRAAGPFGRARRGDRDRIRGTFWGSGRAAAALNLSEEQRLQFREAMRETRDHRRDQRQQIAEAQRSFRQAIRDPERPAEEIQALGEAVGRAQADAAVQQRADRERLAGILTPEQRQRIEELRENRAERFRAGPRGRRDRRRN